MLLPLLLLALTTRLHAHLNFFLTHEEVLKLLGINTDLFYIEKGVINNYALTFTVLIPAHVSNIFFSWQSLTNYSLPYVLAVNYEGGEALLPPEMNISASGVIPTSVQTFRITLMCTGLKTAEISIQVQLNVSLYNGFNTTSLSFKRNKVCLQGIGNTYRNDSIRLDPESLGNATGSLYVAVACAIGMISLVVATTSAVCIKNKKVRSQEAHYMTAIYDNNQHVFLRLGSALGRASSAGSGSYATIASIQKSPPSPSPYATSDACRVSYYASSQIMLMTQRPLVDPRLIDPTKRLRALLVPVGTVILKSVVKEGIFGRIYLAQFGQQETVTVKAIKETASKRQLNLFLSEGTMMFGMDHKNVLKIIGVNMDNPKQPLLIFPCMNLGNLKRFLIKCRQKDETHYTLSTQNLVDMAIQILLGLMYLHSQCVCYKDLATRNCVLDEKLQVKIADNCLSRDLFPNDYFCLADNESRPVKWLALESLLHKQYSVGSDVWSFGVVLWELTTLAQQPFPEIDPFEMGSYLRNGYRLAQPLGCPDELFTVMSYCWLANPTERPQLPQLLAFLQDFYTALCRFI
ncbi:tyrosine-protein kinase Dnt-like [Aethina tumida]|uniref:tyrosine-protein kinase Dnt-like n=1 Tax=Aethina tumida TaxID=116153 RepID=UPI002148C13F|nr:tyrosine-protein kinase Dnt-like [Aethina tumida]